MNIKRLAGPAVLAGFLLSTTPAYAAEHSVRKGETLSGIASEYAIPLDELAAMNPGIKDINLIFPGQKIDVEGKAKIAYKPKAEVAAASSSDADLLARLVEAEAGNESYIGKVAVANVVLARVKDDRFPDSIHAVIYQPGQFSPVSNGMIHRKAQPDSIQAAEEALANPSNTGALYFFNPTTATSTSWAAGMETVQIIENHVFKK